MVEHYYYIEPLTGKHLDAVAEVHRRVFRGYFLANLGPRFIRLTYDDFIKSPIAFGFVAVDKQSGRVLGAVVGTLDGPLFHRFSVRRHMIRKLLLAVGRLPFSLRLWGQVAVRIGRGLKQLMRRGLGLGHKVAPDGLPPQGTPVRLLSIGVVPEARGTGVAGALAVAFEEEATARGADRVGLSCFDSNHQAIRFYEKSGWKRIRAWRGGVSFEKCLTPPPHQRE